MASQRLSQCLPLNLRSGRPRTHRHNHRKGAALVEFALLLPWLILIVLACIDFGRFAYLYIAVTNRARAGKKFAVMRPVTLASQPAWEAGVVAAVQDEMTNNQGYSSTNLAVSTNLTTGGCCKFKASGSHRAVHPSKLS